LNEVIRYISKLRSSCGALSEIPSSPFLYSPEDMEQQYGGTKPESCFRYVLRNGAPKNKMNLARSLAGVKQNSLFYCRRSPKTRRWNL
jgi:hypothetical protein